MSMTVIYEFLTKDEVTIRGEIMNAPEFNVCTRAGDKRLRRLIEAWTGEKIWETLELSTFNEAAAAVRAHMANV